MSNPNSDPLYMHLGKISEDMKKALGKIAADKNNLDLLKSPEFKEQLMKTIKDT